MLALAVQALAVAAVCYLCYCGTNTKEFAREVRQLPAMQTMNFSCSTTASASSKNSRVTENRDEIV